MEGVRLDSPLSRRYYEILGDTGKRLKARLETAEAASEWEDKQGRKGKSILSRHALVAGQGKSIAFWWMDGIELRIHERSTVAVGRRRAGPSTSMAQRSARRHSAAQAAKASDVTWS